MKRETTLTVVTLSAIFALSLILIRREAFSVDLGSPVTPEYGAKNHAAINDYRALVADGTYFNKHRESVLDEELRHAAMTHAEAYESGKLKDIPRVQGEDSLQFGCVAQIHSAKINLVIRLKNLASEAHAQGNNSQAVDDLVVALRVLQIMRDSDTASLAKFLIVEERLTDQLEALESHWTPEVRSTIVKLKDPKRLQASVHKAFESETRLVSFTVPQAKRHAYHELATNALRHLESADEIPHQELEQAPRELRLIIHRTHGMLSTVRRRSLS